MPLLYLSKLSGANMPRSKATSARIDRAIAVLLSRQDSSGAFGLWSTKGAEDIWLNAFVTDFLTRARENKYAVPQSAMDHALDRLRNYVVNASDAKAENGAALAYAIYVLARNGRPVAGDLRYLVDARLDAFDTPLARAQLAAALGPARRPRAGRKGLRPAAARCKKQGDAASRADYGSLLRDGAGLLTLASESHADPAVIVKAARVVDSESAATPTSRPRRKAGWCWRRRRWRRRRRRKSSPWTARRIRASIRRVSTARRWRQARDHRNQGQAPVRVPIGVSGRPTQREPAEEHGYKIERSFFRLDGTPVDPNAIQQNERLVVALKITELEAAYARLILVDSLPAGLEIDNPDLFDGGSAEDLPGSRRRSRRPIPNTRTTVSSPPSSATARTRRHSPSPISFGP